MSRLVWGDLVSDLAATWRRIPSRYRLEGVKCETCGTFYFPPRILCPKCRRNGKIVPYRFSGLGRLYSFTTITAAPSGLELEAPYIMAIVELDEGPRVTAQIVGADEKELRIGMPVKTMFRRLRVDGDEGLIHYGFKFTPVRQ